MGGATPPLNYDVIVSTPEAFRRLQARSGATYAWPSFCVCIFDEVHHVLKDHPYRKLALGIKRCEGQTSGKLSPLQVLGLSASLTYAVGEEQVKKTLVRLSQELRATRMETVDETELRAGGYLQPQVMGDNVERITGMHDVPENIIPQENRRPHLMHKTFMDRVRQGNAT